MPYRTHHETGRLVRSLSLLSSTCRKLLVNPLPAGAEEEWRTGFEKIYPQIRSPKVVPADMFDEVTAALKEFRSREPSGK